MWVMYLSHSQSSLSSGVVCLVFPFMVVNLWEGRVHLYGGF